MVSSADFLMSGFLPAERLECVLMNEKDEVITREVGPNYHVSKEKINEAVKIRLSPKGQGIVVTSCNLIWLEKV